MVLYAACGELKLPVLFHIDALRNMDAPGLPGLERVLKEHPAVGRPGRVAGTRELLVTGTPYILPYRVAGDVLEVLRVLHSARRWPKRL